MCPESAILAKQAMQAKHPETPGSGCVRWHEGPLRFGYSEKKFSYAHVRRLAPGFRWLSLKHTHSAVVFAAATCKSRAAGDGLILGRADGPVAILIRTADCVPLFFWDVGYRWAGILHVGWRGLQQGIEKKALARLEQAGIGPEQLHFFFGPAIEGKCYMVREDVYASFARHSFREKIFSPAVGGKYALDIKAGIRHSLLEAGAAAERIKDSGLCTFCLTDRFPSYRRDGPDAGRIYNFLFFRN